MKTVLLTAVAAAGLTGLALAAAPAIHEMTVNVPGGGIAHVRYTGDTPPKIAFEPRQSFGLPMSAFAPAAFGDFDRIQAMMDRQMAAMMLQARMLQQAASGAPLQSAEFASQPPGMPFAFIANAPGAAVCMHSVSITATGNGQAKVVEHSAGNCAPAAHSATAAPVAAPAPAQAAPMQTISYKPVAVKSPRQGI